MSKHGYSRTCKTQRQEQQEYVWRRSNCMNLGQVERLSSKCRKEIKCSEFLCLFFPKNKSLTVYVGAIHALGAMDELQYAERHWGLSHVSGPWEEEKCRGLAPAARLLGNPIVLKHCSRSCSGNSSSIPQLFVT